MSKFRKIETEIPGLYFIKSFLFQDNRGYFSEIFQKEAFRKLGIEKDLVQENISCSKRAVLRGLHFQEGKEQGKLLRVLKGSIYDVSVDLREDSATFKKWVGVILKENDFTSLWIPEGFAHGFLSLEEDTVIQYHCTEYYRPENERGILWSDETIGIDWKLQEFGLERKDLLLSEKDKKQPSFWEAMEERSQGKILLLGAKGQLGREFQAFFQKKNIEYIATDKEELDITKEEESRNFMRTHEISRVINCAAYNEVDRAEEDRDSCQQLNTEAIAIWKESCQEKQIPWISFSTDYVFDGEKDTPYLEGDNARPLSHYGQSKYLGEKISLEYEKSLLIRTSWLFGSGGKNFCEQLLAWAKDRKELFIVDDQISSPTYTKHLVEFVWELLEKECYGLYHIVNSGEASKYEQARYLFSLIGWQGKLHRANTEDFFSLAKRPKYSTLDTTKVEFSLQKKLPHWKLAIQEYLKEMGKV